MHLRAVCAGDGTQATATEDRDLAARVRYLIKTIVQPRTGMPYPKVDVARMSVGDLTEEAVEGIRTGAIPDPMVGQIAALTAVFRVPASYPVDHKEPPTLDAETLDALADYTANSILRESGRLQEKRIVLGIARGFEGQRETVHGGESAER